MQEMDGLSGDVTRRSFLAMAACGAAGAAMGSRAWAAPGTIPVGIQLYTVGTDLQKDPAGTLKKVAEIGYKEVELASLGTLTAAQMRDMVKEAGLSMPSAHMMFGMAATEKLLDDAKTLGVEYVVSSILLGHPPEGGMQNFLKALNGMTADDFKQTAAKANEIGQKAKAAGLQYAYHNHNFEFRDLGGGQTGYEIILKETDPALVKFEADCGWMSAAGKDPVAFLDRYPQRYVMLHIKDFKNLGKPVTALMAPDAPAPTELGRGSVDLKTVVEAGRKLGIKHMFVEQEPPFKEMAPLEAARVDYQTLHGLLG